MKSNEPQKRNKINDMLDIYIILPYIYQAKVGYYSLIQNVVLRKLLNVLGATVVVIDLKLKMKISRVEYLERKDKHY